MKSVYQILFWKIYKTGDQVTSIPDMFNNDQIHQEWSRIVFPIYPFFSTRIRGTHYSIIGNIWIFPETFPSVPARATVWL